MHKTIKPALELNFCEKEKREDNPSKHQEIRKSLNWQKYHALMTYTLLTTSDQRRAALSVGFGFRHWFLGCRCSGDNNTLCCRLLAVIYAKMFKNQITGFKQVSSLLSPERNFHWNFYCMIEFRNCDLDRSPLTEVIPKSLPKMFVAEQLYFPKSATLISDSFTV